MMGMLGVLGVLRVSGALRSSSLLALAAHNAGQREPRRGAAQSREGVRQARRTRAALSTPPAARSPRRHRLLWTPRQPGGHAGHAAAPGRRRRRLGSRHARLRANPGERGLRRPAAALLGRGHSGGAAAMGTCPAALEPAHMHARPPCVPASSSAAAVPASPIPTPRRAERRPRALLPPPISAPCAARAAAGRGAPAGGRLCHHRRALQRLPGPAGRAGLPGGQPALAGGCRGGGGHRPAQRRVQHRARARCGLGRVDVPVL